MRRLTWGIVAMALMIGAARADESDPTVASFVNLAHAGNPTSAALISGAGRGIEAANTRIMMSGGRLLYCLPGNLELTSDQYVDLLFGFIERKPEWGKAQPALYGDVLLKALVEAFPCK